jgi:hypothetical protein
VCIVQNVANIEIWCLYVWANDCVVFHTNRSVDRLDDIDYQAHKSHNDNVNSANAQTHDDNNSTNNCSGEHPDVNSWKHAATSGMLYT